MPVGPVPLLEDVHLDQKVIESLSAIVALRNPRGGKGIASLRNLLGNTAATLSSNKLCPPCSSRLDQSVIESLSTSVSLRNLLGGK